MWLWLEAQELADHWLDHWRIKDLLKEVAKMGNDPRAPENWRGPLQNHCIFIYYVKMALLEPSWRKRGPYIMAQMAPPTGSATGTDHYMLNEDQTDKYGIFKWDMNWIPRQYWILVGIGPFFSRLLWIWCIGMSCACWRFCVILVQFCSASVL